MLVFHRSPYGYVAALCDKVSSGTCDICASHGIRSRASYECDIESSAGGGLPVKRQTQRMCRECFRVFREGAKEKIKVMGKEIDIRDRAPVVLSKNPWSGAEGELDLREEVDLETAAVNLPEELCEAVNSALAPCPDWLFLSVCRQVLGREEFDKIVHS